MCGKNLIFVCFLRKNPNRKYVEFQSKFLLLSICEASTALLSPLPVKHKDYINKRLYFHEVCYIIHGSNQLKTHRFSMNLAGNPKATCTTSGLKYNK